MDRPRYLSPAQVCDLIPGMTERRLRSLRADRKGPRYYKPSLKTVVYAESDVRAWVEAHMVPTRDQP
jgi:predicted DNA-binding transcriptional regulator AlpA